MVLHIETRVSLKYFVDGCLWKHFYSFGNPKAFHTILT